MNSLGGKITLRVNGSHAAGSCRGNGLAVYMIRNITGSENTFDISACRSFFHFDITGIVLRNEAFENIRIRLMPDGDKKSSDIQFTFYACPGMHYKFSVDGFLAKAFFGFMVKEYFDSGCMF